MVGNTYVRTIQNWLKNILNFTRTQIENRTSTKVWHVAFEVRWPLLTGGQKTRNCKLSVAMINQKANVASFNLSATFS